MKRQAHTSSTNGPAMRISENYQKDIRAIVQNEYQIEPETGIKPDEPS